MEKEIFMGLDPGTESVGWAVTDETYTLQKKNGKSLWGVYMFDEAQPQKERRMHRSTARRLNRRKERISLLQDLFENEIRNVDPLFFKKMNSSFCKFEDKSFASKYNLFSDEDFTDCDFYNLYPTIYHLRKYLLETDEKADIRFIYLAIHHMVKYRGHFTFEGQRFDVKSLNLLQYFEDINTLISDDLCKFSLNLVNTERLFQAFLDNKGITKTKEALTQILQVKKEKNLTAILSLLCGGTVKISDIFENEDYLDLDKLSFNNKFDEIIPTLESALGDDIELIYKCKLIYDAVVLRRLLGKHRYLSYAMVDTYDKHADDLAKLKSFVLKNHKSLYNDIFRNESLADNYPNYVGSNLVDNSKTTLKHSKTEDFYAFLKKKLGIKPNVSEYFDSILQDMEINNYLPRLNSTANGVFPYQLNETEMRIILEKQSAFYPFLLETDEYGTTLEKIISILTFRIPYYVGPLNSTSKFAWVVRTKEKIYPWNFNKVVDSDKSAQEFINRMKSHCTYLYDCNTLAKNTLTYSKFEVLNEINKININGYPISYEDKQRLIQDLFLKNKKVTIQQIKTYFKTLYGDITITSGDNQKDIEEIRSSLSPWIIFKDIFKEDFEAKFNVIENIIEEITIFEDKSILYRRLMEIYNLPIDICKRIKGLSFKGFGRLSKELLIELKTPVVDEMGVIHEKNIMNLLEETNQNFMEIIYNPVYRFKEILNTYNADSDKVDYAMVDALPISPAVKRGIWSTIKIVDEVEDILGRPVDKFFLECNRGNGQKKEKSSSRKKIIADIYKAVDKNIKEYDLLSKKEFDELKDALNHYDDRKLRAKKLCLYFRQLGRCMYSAEPIDIAQLFSDYYDIDHIIPQSLVKDDSLDNLVLVKSSINRQKKDVFPIRPEIITDSARHLWRILLNLKLISENKYDKLIRKNELSPEELIQFINRQLVFTNQTVKIIANLLKIRNKDCRVIWSKASNVSDFRKQFDIPKCREINDLHHAHDAYLNIVVGNVFNSKYGYEMNFQKFQQLKESNISFKIGKIYDYPVKYSGSIMAWQPNKTIVQVKKELSKVEVLTSYMMPKNKGAFYKQTIYPPKDGKTLIPLKKSGPLSNYAKYGGYDNVEFSHFCVVRHLKKGKIQYLFIGLPILITKGSEQDKIAYITNKYKLTNPSIEVDNIRKNMIILQNGFEYRIRGESERVMNVQSYWNLEQTRYIKQIIKAAALEIPKDREEYLIHQSERKKILVSKGLNLKLFDEIIEKFTSKPFHNCPMLYNLALRLQAQRDKFQSLSLQEQCTVLNYIIIVQECKPSRKDLSLIGGPKEAGRISLSVNLPQGTKIITKSVTGYYQKIIFEI